MGRASKIVTPRIWLALQAIWHLRDARSTEPAQPHPTHGSICAQVANVGQEDGWRLSFLVPAIITGLVACGIMALSDDSPRGDLNYSRGVTPRYRIMKTHMYLKRCRRRNPRAQEARGSIPVIYL